MFIIQIIQNNIIITAIRYIQQVYWLLRTFSMLDLHYLCAIVTLYYVFRLRSLAQRRQL